MGADQAAADLNHALIEQAPEAQRRGLFIAVEAGLLQGEPVDFLLGDDPGRHRFQENLPQVKAGAIPSAIGQSFAAGLSAIPGLCSRGLRVVAWGYFA